MPPSREGTRWLNVLITLVIYRLLDPGSECRLHRQWYEQSALGDLLGKDFGLEAKDNLYRCPDRLATQQARPSVRVKLLPKDQELYVFVESQDRLKKERAMRLRKLRGLIKRELQNFKKPLTRDDLLVAVGQAKEQAGRAFKLLDIQRPEEGQEVNATTLTFRLALGRYRHWYLREGRYLLRANLTATDSKGLWEYYLQLVAIEAAFKISRRLADPSNLSPEGGPYRGAYLRGLPGVLFARDVTGQAAAGGRRAHASQSAGKVRRDADDGRVLPDRGTRQRRRSCGH